MIIIGAGMAGLLAANMLSRHAPVVHEKQDSLPHNHSAVLRFKTSLVGDVLNVQFRKVTMVKSALPWRNSVADVLAYSFKNGGQYRSDRSIIAGDVIDERWIAPGNLIETMAKRVNVECGREARFDNGGPHISTIPMPDLMRLLSYPERIPFYYHPGINFTAKVADCDAFVSLLTPDPSLWFSRISITGDELSVECPGATAKWPPAEANQLMFTAAGLLGIDLLKISAIEQHYQLYAKIQPIDNEERRKFIFWATDKHHIFSLGRYATWRPGLQLDDLVNDIRLIERWVADKYSMSMHR